MKIYFILFLIFFVAESKTQDFIQSPFQDFPLSNPILVDLNGDDYLDVFGWQVNFAGPNKIVLQLNNGTSPVDFTIQDLDIDFDADGQPAAADLDGDNDQDIVIAKGPNLDLFLLRNDGDANFEVDSLGVSGGELLELVDIDNDDDVDIVSINTDANSVDLFLNDGNQNFFKTNILSSSNSPEMFEIGDMDKDNDVDIVIGFEGANANHIVWLKNNGGNNFEEIPIVANTFFGLTSIVLGDINSDGNMDIIATRGFLANAFINDGGTFTKEDIFSYNNTIRQVTLGDYNGDSKMDILIGTNSDGVFWYKNISTSTLAFEPAAVVGPVAPIFSLLHGDLDNDGDEDVVVSNREFWWFENTIIQESVSTLNFLEETINIFPNPCRDFIRVENLEEGPYLLNVIDVNGQTVFSSKVVSNLIDISRIETGLYYFSLSNATQTLSTLIYKQK